MEREEDYLLESAPKDKYWITYIVFYIIGISSTLPWRFFLASYDRWMYEIGNENTDCKNSTSVQSVFGAEMFLASTGSGFVVFFTNAAIAHIVSSHVRVVSSHISLLVIFTVMTVFVKLNYTISWPTYIVWAVTIIVLANVASTFIMSTTYGILCNLSPFYITAFTGGQALSGILTSFVDIISTAAGNWKPCNSPIGDGVFSFFIIGDLSIIASLLGYYYISKKSVFFQYYLPREVTVVDEEVEEEEEGLSTLERWKSVIEVIWPYCYSCFLIYMVTYAISPGVSGVILKEGVSSVTYDKYAVPILNYFISCVSDFAGRLMACKIQKPTSGPLQIALSASRLVFIPFIFVCRLIKDPGGKGFVFSIFSVVCNFSYGYLVNLAAINAIRTAPEHEKQLGAYIYTLFLGSGLLVGSLFQLWILELF